jgi:hypothetical protein
MKQENKNIIKQVIQEELDIVFGRIRIGRGGYIPARTKEVEDKIKSHKIVILREITEMVEDY